MKMKQVREMTDAELKSKLEEMNRERLNQSIQSRTGQLEKTANVRLLRRDIARVNTELTVRAAKQAK